MRQPFASLRLPRRRAACGRRAAVRSSRFNATREPWPAFGDAGRRGRSFLPPPAEKRETGSSRPGTKSAALSTSISRPARSSSRQADSGGKQQAVAQRAAPSLDAHPPRSLFRLQPGARDLCRRRSSRPSTFVARSSNSTTPTSASDRGSPSLPSVCRAGPLPLPGRQVSPRTVNRELTSGVAPPLPSSSPRILPSAASASSEAALLPARARPSPPVVMTGSTLPGYVVSGTEYQQWLVFIVAHATGVLSLGCLLLLIWWTGVKRPTVVITVRPDLTSLPGCSHACWLTGRTGADRRWSWRSCSTRSATSCGEPPALPSPATAVSGSRPWLLGLRRLLGPLPDALPAASTRSTGPCRRRSPSSATSSACAGRPSSRARRSRRPSLSGRRCSAPLAAACPSPSTLTSSCVPAHRPYPSRGGRLTAVPRNPPPAPRLPLGHVLRRCAPCCILLRSAQR